MKKRILSAFLVLCMMLTMVPTAALAAEDPGGGNGSDRVHTESNDGVVVDKTVNYDEDGNYSLTLEAYVTNEVTKGSKTTPLDIVLVLDVSGSMDDDLGESTWEYTPTDEQRWSYSDINGSRWTTYYFRDDDGNYYEVEAESDGSWGNRQYSIGYYTGSGFYRDWNQLGTTSRNQNANLWTGTLYTRQEITTSKMEAMQSAVNGFIDQVAENAAGADNDVTHRISIVKFADDSYADSVGNDRQDDYYAYNYTQIVKDFTTVDAAGVQQLTGAMPLVLHGGTGIPEDMIKKAISLGVSKINVNTECQLSFAAATRKYIEEGKDQQGKGFDPRKLLAPGFEAIKATVKEKMELFGSVNKA